MSDPSLIDVVWRGGNGVIALVAFIVLGKRVVARWHDIYSERMRFLMMSLMTFLATLALGSVENIAQGNPIGFRTAMATAAASWVIYAALFTEEGFTRAEQQRRRDEEGS